MELFIKLWVFGYILQLNAPLRKRKAGKKKYLIYINIKYALHKQKKITNGLALRFVE